jgi:hypothetical protein
MTDPAVTAIPINVWTKIATNVTSGQVWPLGRNQTTKVKYVQTYRDTGGAAPTNGDLSEAVDLPYDGLPISASAGIDVYVAVTGTVAGSVRVDL